MKSVKSTLLQIIKRKDSLLFLVILISGLGLYGLLFGNIGLASYSSKYIHIHYASAALYIALSVLLYLNINFEKSQLIKVIVTVFLIAIASYCSIIFLDYLFNFTWDFDAIFINNPERLERLKAAHISPISSLLVIFICLSILSIRQNNTVLIKYIGDSFSLLVCLTASVFLIGYLYKAPLLYGGQITPVSLVSAICILLLGITLLRGFKFQFWTFNLIKDNRITRQLLRTFLPIVVFLDIFHGLLIVNVSTRHQNTVLFDAVVLLIVIVITVIVIFRISQVIGDKLLRAELALKDSEEKFRALYEKSNDAIMLLDRDGFFDCNPQTLELFKVKTKEEFIKFHPAELSPSVQSDGKNSFEAAQEHINIAFSEGYNKFEWIHRRTDGEDFHASVLLSTFNLGGEEILQATVRDISKRKRSEEALLKLRKAIDSSGEAVFLTDREGIITFINPGFTKTYGYDAAEVVGKVTPRILKSGTMKEERYKIFWDTLLAGKEVKGELQNKRKDGTIIDIEGSANTIFEENKNIIGFLGIQRDITKRKQAEKELIDVKESLVQLNRRFEEVSENERALISRELHDGLSQTLTALKIDIHWLSEKIAIDSEEGSKLKGINELLLTTIKDVQSLSTELRPVMLDDIGLPAAIEWHSENFMKRTGINCHLKLDEIHFSDQNKSLVLFRTLQEAFTNIERHAYAKNVNVNLFQDQDSIIMEVIDDGIGIEKEKINSFKSLGFIGMQERAKKYKGSIKISSTLNKGTKLGIRIPIN